MLAGHAGLIPPGESAFGHRELCEWGKQGLAWVAVLEGLQLPTLRMLLEMEMIPLEMMLPCPRWCRQHPLSPLQRLLHSSKMVCAAPDVPAEIPLHPSSSGSLCIPPFL